MAQLRVIWHPWANIVGSTYRATSNGTRVIYSKCCHHSSIHLELNKNIILWVIENINVEDKWTFIIIIIIIIII